ncbi:folC1 protein [Lactobacillus selangorensis]|uniref:tetrahydrofolate synthase n=1 Tax=Lactobacillus selangorensis TaxID=81857 RepID=A0A0R2G0Q3_9LACO|nr:folylpolyglutamate synthase/dihydrofolate synthase family protein [Lactobacillus selangorensis]KRN29343.1 folC1 protein [Lactobacillus selangorensis]KRN34128.1 folC1 protein [Lactobacillus selangorensis]
MQLSAYADAVAYIHSRPRLLKDGRLQRMTRLMDALDNPQDLLQIVHVTGTNGKGSVVNDLSWLFQESGLKTGMFTSPFLTRFNERFQIDHQSIPDDRLLELTNLVGTTIEQLQKQQPDFGVTEFEFITALCFVYFAQEHVDVALIEVGIGGLHDSTNILTPVVAVITTVGMDHMQMLGDTLAKIAHQKAGIIKPHHPTVIGQLPDEATAVVLKEAAERDSQVYALNRDFQTSQRQTLPNWAEQFDFENDERRFRGLEIPMIGAYQVDNAAVALEAYLVFLKIRQIDEDEQVIRRALKKAFWAGRLEKVNERPLIVLDGAHNEPGIKGLLSVLRENFAQQHLFVLYAGLKDKALDKILPLLQNEHLQLTVTTVPDNPRAASEADYAPYLKPTTHFVDQWPQGLVQIVQQMSDSDVLLITGSLYFISDVRRYFKEEQ